MADIRSVLDTDKEAWAKHIMNAVGGDLPEVPDDFATWSEWDKLLALLAMQSSRGVPTVKKVSEFELLTLVIYLMLHGQYSDISDFDTFVQTRSGQTESGEDEGGGDDEGGDLPK